MDEATSQLPEPSGKWLWDPYIKRRTAIALFGEPRIAPCTRVGFLLKQMGDGGEFAPTVGCDLTGTVIKGKALVLTGYASKRWNRIRNSLGLGDWVSFCTASDYHDMDFVTICLDVARIVKDDGIDLVVMDQMEDFAGPHDLSDEQVGGWLAGDLECITDLGATVLTLHALRDRAALGRSVAEISTPDLYSSALSQLYYWRPFLEDPLSDEDNVTLKQPD